VALITLFAFVVVRGLYKAMKLNDTFEQVAARFVRAGGPAGHHQYRRELEHDPDQGHDACRSSATGARRCWPWA
jgi:hypothetical protein